MTVRRVGSLSGERLRASKLMVLVLCTRGNRHDMANDLPCNNRTCARFTCAAILTDSLLNPMEIPCRATQRFVPAAYSVQCLWLADEFRPTISETGILIMNV